jgi:hypothetical protein
MPYIGSPLARSILIGNFFSCSPITFKAETIIMYCRIGKNMFCFVGDQGCIIFHANKNYPVSFDIVKLRSRRNII